jgi:hypothetical protein
MTLFPISTACQTGNPALRQSSWASTVTGLPRCIASNAVSTILPIEFPRLMPLGSASTTREPPIMRCCHTAWDTCGEPITWRSETTLPPPANRWAWSVRSAVRFGGIPRARMGIFCRTLVLVLVGNVFPGVNLAARDASLFVFAWLQTPPRGCKGGEPIFDHDAIRASRIQQYAP